MKAKHLSGCLCVPVNSWGLLGPEKKVNFLVLSSFLAFRNRPKAHSNSPFPTPRYQHPCASQGSLVAWAKQHLRDTLPSPNFPHATPCPQRGGVLLCASSTRGAQGVLLSHSQGYHVGWGWMCGIYSPREPRALWGLYGRRNTTTKH